MLGMRTPDLGFITLNNFIDIKKSDYFRPQELLITKSIMDICLSDTESVIEALDNYDMSNDDLTGSIVQILCKDD